MTKRINKFDMFVYRLFYWRWKPLLDEDPQLLSLFREWITSWQSQQDDGLELERERIRAGQICTDKAHWTTTKGKDRG